MLGWVGLLADLNREGRAGGRVMLNSADNKAGFVKIFTVVASAKQRPRSRDQRPHRPLKQDEASS